MMKTQRVFDSMYPSLVVRELWDVLADDWATESMDPSDFVARVDDNSFWYVGTHFSDIVAAYWCHRINGTTWQAHVNTRKKYWGDRETTRLAKETLKMMFNDTGASKIIAVIPASSPHVIQFTQRLGFTIEGRRTNSYIKDGVMYDEVYFGIDKGQEQ